MERSFFCNSSTKKDLEKFLKYHPEEFASLLNSWKNENAGGGVLYRANNSGETSIVAILRKSYPHSTLLLLTPRRKQGCA